MCECGYEAASGSINYGEFLVYLEYRLASHEELCYMGLLSVDNRLFVTCWVLWLVGWLVS